MVHYASALIPHAAGAHSSGTIVPGTYTGTVTLTSPTLAGALVTLVSSNAAFQLPATVMIPAGGISATFQATLPATSTPQVVTVTANYVGSFAQATVAAAGKWVSQVELGPGPLVPSDGSESGIMSGSFTSNGSGGYGGGFTFSNNGSDAFPSFLLYFDNAQMAGNTLARSSTSNRQDAKPRGFTGLLGVLAASRETLLPVH